MAEAGGGDDAPESVVTDGVVEEPALVVELGEERVGDGVWVEPEDVSVAVVLVTAADDAVEEVASVVSVDDASVVEDIDEAVTDETIVLESELEVADVADDDEAVEVAPISAPRVSMTAARQSKMKEREKRMSVGVAQMRPNDAHTSNSPKYPTTVVVSRRQRHLQHLQPIVHAFCSPSHDANPTAMHEQEPTVRSSPNRMTSWQAWQAVRTARRARGSACWRVVLVDDVARCGTRRGMLEAT